MSSRLTLKQGFISSVIRDGTDSYKKKIPLLGRGKVKYEKEKIFVKGKPL